MTFFCKYLQSEIRWILGCVTYRHGDLILYTTFRLEIQNNFTWYSQAMSGERKFILKTWFYSWLCIIIEMCLLGVWPSVFSSTEKTMIIIKEKAVLEVTLGQRKCMTQRHIVSESTICKMSCWSFNIWLQDLIDQVPIFLSHNTYHA